ncbi:MAG: hypothetical protein AAF558_09890 [Verrucomicrobiota bacterium]
MGRPYSESQLFIHAEEFLKSKYNLAQFARLRGLPYMQFKRVVRELAPEGSFSKNDSELRLQLISEYCLEAALFDEFCQKKRLSVEVFEKWLNEATLKEWQHKVIREKEIVHNYVNFEGDLKQFANLYRINKGTVRKALEKWRPESPTRMR